MITIFQLQAVVSWEGHRADTSIFPVPVHIVDIPVFVGSDKDELEEMKALAQKETGSAIFHLGDGEPTEHDLIPYLAEGFSREKKFQAKNIQFTKFNLERLATAKKKNEKK